jgi:hypothetical protein
VGGIILAYGENLHWGAKITKKFENDKGFKKNLEIRLAASAFICIFVSKTCGTDQH